MRNPIHPFSWVQVTEDAAKACFSFIGRGDKHAADGAAVRAMRQSIEQIFVRGKIVIGEGERDEAPMLYIGEHVGGGWHPKEGHQEHPRVDMAFVRKNKYWIRSSVWR